MTIRQAPIRAADAAPNVRKTGYPPPFAALMEARTKRPLGDLFGLSNFGVNLTTLEPGGTSALFHCHGLQDEFVFVVSGEAVLRLGDAEYPMQEGDCAGFSAGTGIGHQLVNRGQRDLVYLEIGDRSAGDRVDYPQDDLLAVDTPGSGWVFMHKDGTPYEGR